MFGCSQIASYDFLMYDEFLSVEMRLCGDFMCNRGMYFSRGTHHTTSELNYTWLAILDTNKTSITSYLDALSNILTCIFG